MNVRRQLGEILIAHRFVTRPELVDARAEQRSRPRPLGQILIERGCISKRQLIQVLAAQRGIGCWFESEGKIDVEFAKKIGLETCHTNWFLPVETVGDLLVVAMADSEDIETLDLIRNLTGKRIQPLLADKEELERAILRLRGVSGGSEGRREFSVEAKKLAASLSLSERRAARTELTEEETKPVESLVNAIISDAIKRGATDIHFEPEDGEVVVRLRIDGILRKIASVPSELGPVLAARIKVMSGLDIVEHRAPQDGQANVTLGDRPVDLRVSVVPAQFGARIVLRVLDHRRGLQDIENLRLSPANRAVFEGVLARPHGLFLVSGPTGSGKTTTLYAALNKLVDGTRNILTVENPIEYSLDGVGQAQVNPKIGVTFSTLLRAFLRQDPDVIMVGEIRDEDTASTCMRAAMTGHLVFATVHSNDAPSVVARLLDLGMDANLLSSCLVGTMAQRLVRAQCPQCRVPGEPGRNDGGIALRWHSPGCDACEGSGLLGRIAVHEIMPTDGDVARLIARRASVDELAEAAARVGYVTMAEDGLAKVDAGLTTLEELRRHVWLEPDQDVAAVRSDRLAAS